MAIMYIFHFVQEYMELHAALQAATGEKPRRRRNRDTDSQETMSSSESELTQDPALLAEESATNTEGTKSKKQKLDCAQAGAQVESPRPAAAAADQQHEIAARGSDAGSSSAQLIASSSAVDDSDPEVNTSESDDGAESSDVDLADLADPVISDALADSKSEEEPSQMDVAALRDADIQRMQKRANVLRGQMK